MYRSLYSIFRRGRNGFALLLRVLQQLQTRFSSTSEEKERLATREQNGSFPVTSRQSPRRSVVHTVPPLIRTVSGPGSLLPRHGLGITDSSTCLELALEGERLCKCGDFAGGIAFFEAAIKVGTTDMRTLSAIYSQLGNAYFYLNNYEKALNFHQLDLAIAKSVSVVVFCVSPPPVSHLIPVLRLHEPNPLTHAHVVHDRRLFCDRRRRSSSFSEAILVCVQYMINSFCCCFCFCRCRRSMRDRVGEGKASGNLGNTLKMLSRFDEGDRRLFHPPDHLTPAEGSGKERMILKSFGIFPICSCSAHAAHSQKEILEEK